MRRELVFSYLGSVLVLAVSSLATAATSQKIKWDPRLPKKQFVEKILRQMTLEEKIGQLNQYSSGMDKTGPVMNPNYLADLTKGKVGSILNAYSPTYINKLQKIAVEQTRLGIPVLFAYDVIHGHRTIFPIPLGESNSWDLPLMQETARIAAKEASADGIHWTFAPMVDLARDPRWGRVSEGSGEDPWLGSEIAKAKVRGYQGETFSNPETILACVKHFALYGAPQGGREYNTVDMSQRSMYENYLVPYRGAIEAGAASVMPSFNEINGIPSTANSWLLNTVLRKEWGFQGFVITDYTAIHELIAHGIAENDQKASELAIRAGVDMDMQSSAYSNELAKLVQSGKISPKLIDDAARRILNAKYDLGLFQDPYRKVTEERAREVLMIPAHLEVARKIAQESITLLKNKDSILPLKPGTRVALIGPLAQNKRDLLGNWSAAGDWTKAISVAQGLDEKTDAGLKIRYERGANLMGDSELLRRLNEHGTLIEIDSRSPSKMIEDAVDLAKDSDVVVAVMGESHSMTGEAASRSDIGLPSTQVDLLKALASTHKPIVLVLINGRPLTLEWENQNVAAIVEAWFLGHETGHAVADVLVGDYNPSGRLTMSFPRNVGQIPIYYSPKNTGRPMSPNEWYTSRYLDVTNDPLFPFGFGLSYSKIVYGDLKIDHPKMTMKNRSAQVRVSLPVTNSSTRAAVETVQLYVRDVVGSVTRPLKELKGFKKVELAPGETKNVEFAVALRDLEFYDQNLKKVLEPGEFRFMVGPNSSDLKEVKMDLTQN